MLNGTFQSSGLRQKIDHLMDILWSGGLNNPMDSIEQLSYLVFLRLLSERDDQLAALGRKYTRVFTGDWAKFAWGNFVTLTGDPLFDAVRAAMEKIEDLPGLSDTGKQLFRRANLKIYDRPTLRAVIQGVNDLDLEQEGLDVKGDMYEYLLGKLNASGTNGQFRTPRHIVDFIVKVVDPQPNETICDPACGTAGFLISSYKHILQSHTPRQDLDRRHITGSLLAPQQWDFLQEQAFTGFDNDANMVKIAVMNLYLHNLEKAKVSFHNPLTTGIGTPYPGKRFDVILANPPFSGKVQQESILADLNLNTRATELLFIQWFIDHLAPNGRAGFIVPEGVIFQSANAHKQIRKTLIEKDFLWAVVSLPAGAFNPYSGVKCSILFLDRELAKKTDQILFVKVENDGLDLGAQRKPIEKNDLPKIILGLNDFKQNLTLPDDTQFTWVSKITLSENGDYNLSSERYRSEISVNVESYPHVRIKDISNFINDGNWIESDDQSSSGIRLIQTGNVGFAEFLDKPEKARFISEEKFKELDCTEVFPGDVLISRLPDPVGRACLVPNLETRMVTAVDCSIVRFKQDLIIPNYFIYLTITDGYYGKIKQYLTGSSRQRISRKNLEEVIIPLPPLDVQQQIVDEIAAYQRIIDGARQVVDNWKPDIENELRKSLPEGMEAWEKVNLGDVCEIISGQSPSGKNYNETGIGTPFYQGKTEFTEIYLGAPRVWTTEVTRLANEGDILISVRAPVGPVNITNQQICIGRGLAAIRPKKIDHRYLFNWLKSKEDSIKGNGGAVFDSISRDQIIKIKIPFPSLEIQRAITSRIEHERSIVEGNRELIKIYEEKIKQVIDRVWEG